MIKSAYDLGVKVALQQAGLLARQDQWSPYAEVPHVIPNIGEDIPTGYDKLLEDRRKAQVENSFMIADRSTGFADDRAADAPAPAMNN
jgi:hypothetical protein